MLNLFSLNIILSVLARTLIIFLFAFLIIRLLGKRHLSHFTSLDLLLVIALGSAVGDVMIYDESVVQIISSMTAITAVAIIVKILTYISYRFRQASFLLEGTARLIVENGKILSGPLTQEGLSEGELMGILRIKGFDSLKEIKKAFIETDGEVSVISERKVF